MPTPILERVTVRLTNQELLDCIFLYHYLERAAAQDSDLGLWKTSSIQIMARENPETFFHLRVPVAVTLQYLVESLKIRLSVVNPNGMANMKGIYYVLNTAK